MKEWWKMWRVSILLLAMALFASLAVLLLIVFLASIRLLLDEGVGQCVVYFLAMVVLPASMAVICHFWAESIMSWEEVEWRKRYALRWA